jgi:hypothetical protein
MLCLLLIEREILKKKKKEKNGQGAFSPGQTWVGIFLAVRCN